MAGLFLWFVPCGIGQAGVRVASELTSHFTVTPGGRYEASLVLENPDPEPGRVRLYQTDYRFDAEGHSFYDDPGSHPRSNATWVRIVAPPTLTVAPRSRATVPVEVAVPNDANLVGTYWSMVMVELLPAQQPQGPSGTATARPPERVQFGLAQRFRYGVQIVTQVGDTGQQRLTFIGPKLVRSGDGSYRFQVDLVNAGERWITPQVWMEVYGSTDARIDRFDGQPVRLFPGTSYRERIGLGSVRPGVYQALLIADGGDGAIFGARYTLDLSGH